MLKKLEQRLTTTRKFKTPANEPVDSISPCFPTERNDQAFDFG